MSQWMIRTLAALTLAVLLFSLAQITVAQSAAPPAQDKALRFITDVLQLDMTQYNASLTHYDKSYGLSNMQEESVSYNLENNGKIATVRCSFLDSLLDLCMVTAPVNASLVFANQSGSTVDAAKGILERYQTFIADSSVKEMLDLLNTVDAVRNITVQTETSRLEITITAPYTIFCWKHTFNGCDYNEIEFVFKGGERFTFSDHHSRHKMGSTNVNISEEQAIEMAIEYVKNYSYTVRRGSEGNVTYVQIGNFNITREGTFAQLLPGERNKCLYPVWRVSVALGNVYPGNVYAIGVDIWADTAKVANTALRSFGGPPPANPSTGNPTTESSPSPEQSNGTPPNSIALPTDMGTLSIAVAATCVAAIAAATLILKKRRSR